MLQAVRRHLRAQIDEIAGSRALRYYGLALSFIHVVSFIFMSGSLRFKLAFGGWPVCWPFFDSCGALRELPSFFWQAAFFIYLLLAFAAGALFLTRNTVALAYGLLATATALKYFIFAQDYQFMGNYHYMPFITALAFLLIPEKVRVIPVLTVLYYVAAGVLKFNPQWLNGETMSKPPFLTQELFAFSCGYVVILETLLVWGLLSSNRKVRWVTLFQFACFHAASFYWVGYFYPSVMFSLISLFPMIWVMGDGNGQVPGDSLALKKMPRSAIVGFGLFFSAQVIPFLYSGDTAVTGQGRVFSINMYDARTKCYDVTMLRYKGQTVEASGVIPALFAPRVHCDPLVFLSEIREICKRESKRPDFIDADLALYSRRANESEYQKLVHVRDACHKKPQFRLVGPNQWVSP